MIIAFPHSPGHGGPGSFQERFEKALVAESFRVAYAGDNLKPDIIFVIGGTKRLFWLLKMKLKGVPIIHRLDGLAWLHRRSSWKAFLKGEWGNLVFKIIHSFLADHVVYQSYFVEKWWEKAGWRKPKAKSIINNGVDLQEFKPISNPAAPKSLLCVEGTLDYSTYAINLLNTLQTELIEKSDYQRIVLYGGFQNQNNRSKLHAKIDYKGKVTRADLPSIYRDAVYLSLDVNPACPNTVIEAMACGIPIVGYDTGALKEIVQNAGEIADFGRDPWKLEEPLVDNLVYASKIVLNNWHEYASKARTLAESNFSIDHIVNEYIEIIKKINST